MDDRSILTAPSGTAGKEPQRHDNEVEDTITSGSTLDTTPSPEFDSARFCKRRCVSSLHSEYLDNANITGKFKGISIVVANGLDAGKYTTSHVPLSLSPQERSNDSGLLDSCLSPTLPSTDENLDTIDPYSIFMENNFDPRSDHLFFDNIDPYHLTTSGMFSLSA